MNKALILLFFLSLTSCASIFGKKRQEVEFNSEPQGAKVYFNGKYIGITPLKYKIGLSNTAIEEDNGKWDISQKYHEIIYMKEGFYNQEFKIHRSKGGTWSTHTRNNVLCGIDIVLLIPAIVDVSYGVCDKFQNSYFKALEEKKINLIKK